MVKTIWNSGQDWAEGVAIDNKNRMVYIVGFLQIGEFGDLEAEVFEEETYEEIFLIKYDFEGNKIYEKLYGTKRNDAGRSICIDNEDNIYIVGDTDGGWFIENETERTNSFIVKLTSEGNILWGKEFGSNEQDYAIDVYVDKNGDIYVVGVMNIKETFDTADAFICKYDKNGNQIWMKEIKVDGKEDVISGIKVKEGNVYIVGYSEGNLFSENKGKSDIFIAKYNTNGEFIWGEMIGIEQGDSGNDIVIDAQGNIYLVGDTEGNLFGANIGGWDVFIIKFRDKS
ncbi:MAG: SBBP repeat-containing protein [archaeon YNP-LCB-024-027]|nr:SBBP repeat-containing protein [Candidatus Culexarchaeum yellowstonense]